MKFRVWDKRKKKFITDVVMDTEGEVYLNEDIDYAGQALTPISDILYKKQPRYIVERGLGIKDSIGTDIYEGDIILHDYSAGHERDSFYDIYYRAVMVYKNGQIRYIKESDSYDYSGKGEEFPFYILPYVTVESHSHII